MPGHIQNRGNDTWRLIVTIGSDFSGKPKRFTKTVHCTEKEAKKELALFYTDCERGLVNKSDITTVSGVADAYVKSHVKRYCKKSVIRTYEGVINIWIKPYIGGLKIGKIKRQGIQEWINFLEDKELSPKTVRNYYSVLRRIFEYVIDVGIIEVSPCQNIRLPKKISKEAHYYNMQEVQTLVEATELLSNADLRFKCANSYSALRRTAKSGNMRSQLGRCKL